MSKQWIRCSREIRSLTNELSQMRREPINSARISSVVSQRRSSSNICSCLRRRSASARTNSQISPPCECDSHSAPRGPVVVPPKGSSVVAWFQRCLRVSRLLEVPSSCEKKTHRTGPTFQEFPELQRKVQVWCAKIATTCVDGGSDVLLGPFDAYDSCG